MTDRQQLAKEIVDIVIRTYVTARDVTDQQAREMAAVNVLAKLPEIPTESKGEQMAKRLAEHIKANLTDGPTTVEVKCVNSADQRINQIEERLNNLERRVGELARRPAAPLPPYRGVPRPGLPRY